MENYSSSWETASLMKMAVVSMEKPSGTLRLRGVPEQRLLSPDLGFAMAALKGCDLSNLLTFDPESIEPATSKAGEEPSPSTVHGPLQRLKALLSSSVETLVENPEAVKGILEDIQPHLRDTADKCQRLNEKKAALDAKTDTSANSAELETLRKELENLEERVRVTKQLIQDKETLIARSQEEAKGLTADLKTDLAEIRALSSQLVTGKDEDDEAEIAEVDRIRADALHALNAFLQ
ncbi:hypothetical protein QYE76_023612 [Lolium multiflorum]|uniref:Uncharacterized protein n=1 Tax=Lolium multiflorum TaxID=4521 RepID=A0AAD8VUW7_LOLMU|nr:hypothetical protein QYE76_023612 [Lolium multiflorum]